MIKIKFILAPLRYHLRLCVWEVLKLQETHSFLNHPEINVGLIVCFNLGFPDEMRRDQNV